MNKDILKSIIAISFVFISLLCASILHDMKSGAKEEAKAKKKEEMSKTYDDGSHDFGFNLPLLIIDTKGNKVSDSEKLKAYLQVYDSENKLNYIADDPVITSDINIKIRGNSTRAFPKKQYSIELAKKNNQERKEKLLGMNKESDWVLNGPFADKSLMRNYLVYKTSRNIMEYASDAKFCEVIVIDDGSDTIKKSHYKGVYILIEKIKRGENRVDISKSQSANDETSFIVSKNSQKEGDITLGNYGYETSLYDYGINIEYPTKNLTKEKYEYINKHISEFERVLYSYKFNDPYEGYNKYIDVDTFVDYYIINEFFKNTDAGILSTNIYKDYNEKIKAGPVWDFNSSLGNHSKLIGPAFDYTGFYMIEKTWFGRLMEDITFAKNVEERYKYLRKTYLSDEFLIDLIDETVLHLGDAIERNFTTWPIYMCNQPDMFKVSKGIFKQYENNPQALDKYLQQNPEFLRSTNGRSTSYEEEITRMKDFIIQRGQWMDENIDSLTNWAK